MKVSWNIATPVHFHLLQVTLDHVGAGTAERGSCCRDRLAENREPGLRRPGGDWEPHCRIRKSATRKCRRGPIFSLNVFYKKKTHSTKHAYLCRKYIYFL